MVRDGPSGGRRLWWDAGRHRFATLLCLGVLGLVLLDLVRLYLVARDAEKGVEVDLADLEADVGRRRARSSSSRRNGAVGESAMPSGGPA